jgi:hypothetical protein
MEMESSLHGKKKLKYNPSIPILAAVSVRWTFFLDGTALATGAEDTDEAVEYRNVAAAKKHNHLWCASQLRSISAFWQVYIRCDNLGQSKYIRIRVVVVASQRCPTCHQSSRGGPVVKVAGSCSQRVVGPILQYGSRVHQHGSKSMIPGLAILMISLPLP